MREAELRVNLGTLRDNARAIRRSLPDAVRLMAVVKADAYGHGLAGAAKAFLAGGADALAVAIAEEAAALREAGIAAPILIMGGAGRESVFDAVRLGAAQSVYLPETLEQLQAASEKFGVPAMAHFKIDTGMARIGARGKNPVERMLEMWKRCPDVQMEGIFTHFAVSDTDPEYTAHQNELFGEAISMARAAGFSPIAHAAATYAFEDEPYQHGMVRPGLALYGFGARNPEPRGAQTLAARPVRIERISAGETVSYGRTYTAARETLVMTVPIGYGDGYPRILSNRASALVNGVRVPLIGRMCMDMAMFDATDAGDVTLESEVVLMGEQGNDAITPCELAELSGTIPYEIMLGFLPRVRRVTLDF